MGLDKRYIKYPLLASINFVGAFLIGSFMGVHYFTRTDRRAVKKLESIAGLPLREVETITRDGLKVAAWLIHNNSEKVVMILSGRGSNRNKNIEKAKLYLSLGYSVLLPDLRGTGNSAESRLSFGWNEKKDVRAWYHFLQSEGFSSVAAHGFSAGAAAIAFNLKKITDFEFVVLESCYTDVYTAIKNTLKAKNFPSIIPFTMKHMTERLLGVKSKKMSPLRYIRSCDVPVLLMCGDSEDVVKVSESKALFKACPHPKKLLHIFKGGKHESFYKQFPEEFEKTLKGFLNFIVN